MNGFRKLFFIYLAIGLMILGFAGQSDAQNRRSEREVRDIIRNLNSKIDDFEYNLTYQLRSTSADRQEIDGVTASLRNLQDRIRAFEADLDNRRENVDDVSGILDAAKNIDDFLSVNQQNRRVETDWAEARRLLDRLASVYNAGRSGQNTGASNNSNDSNDSDDYPANSLPSTPSSFYGLSGTYRLDAARSESADEILSVSDVSGDADRRDLQNKLEAPEEISIEMRGNQVTLASSKAAPVTFTADGTTRTENSNGQTLRLRAILRGEELTVSSLGGETDYTITFALIDNGKSLKVTRRITTNYLSQTVFAESVYDKIGANTGLGSGNTNYPSDSGTYSTNQPDDSNSSTTSYPTSSSGRNNYIVPNGTIITGLLDNDIDTQVSQNNDRFRLTVQSPDQFRGATVEGYISGINRSGQVSGRSQVTFNFERIKLRNGQSYDFAGFLQSITDTNGKTVRVDAESGAKGDSQTKETVKRGGIGAGIGAIIGAIAGGGKGAAIGAIIGGGAGAGSVVLQGRDDLQLKKGSSITVQASAPSR